VNTAIRSSPDPAEMAERYGAEMTVSEWRKRLACSQCGCREINMVVTGTERRERAIDGLIDVLLEGEEEAPG